MGEREGYLFMRKGKGKRKRAAVDERGLIGTAKRKGVAVDERGWIETGKRKGKGRRGMREGM